MSNQDYLATAFVQIKPRTVGFNAELRKQIKAAIDPIKNVTVHVDPSTKGFSAKLRKQVRDAIISSGKHTVPVTPVLTKFRAQMIKQLNEKPIPVTVAPTGKAATGAKGAISAERDLTEAERARKTITDQLRESERLIKESTREGIPLKERDALVTRAQALAREALTSVTQGQLVGERLLVQEQLKLRGIKAETAADKAAGGVSDEKKRLDDEAKAAEDAERSQKTLAETKESLATVNDKLVLSHDRINQAVKSSIAPSEKLTVVNRELDGIIKRRIGLEEQLQGALRRNETEQAALVRGSIRQAQSIESVAKVEKARLDTLAASQALSTSQAQIAGKLIKANQVQIASLTTLAEVRSVENALQKQSTALDKLEEKAQQQNAAATLAFVEAKRAEIATTRTALADQGDLIKSGQKSITQNRNLGRGLIATSLSFLGLRGATLAAGGAFLAGAAAASLFAKSVSSAANLEQELNVFQATADATADEMERVQETAKQLGADITLPAVGASDAAKAMTNLAKAGLNVEDAMDGARGTLQLATAAEIGNAEATELVASALNSFALEGADAVRVADLLTGAANEAQGTITDMGIALQQSSAVARQAGISLEDTVAFITLLAKNGIRGSDAGTSLRTAILRLIAPTQDANKALRGLSVSVLDAAGNLRPEAFADLQKALDGLDATTRNQTLRKIFGQDAIRAAVIFGREGRAGLDAVREATQEVGLASELAEARTKGFSGQIAALRNNAETLGLTFGKLTLGPLGAFVDTLNEIVSTGNSAVKAIQDMNNVNKAAVTGGGDGGGGGFGGFLSGVAESVKGIPITTGDLLKEFKAIKQAGEKDLPFAFGSARAAIKNFNKEARETVSGVRNIAQLFDDFKSPDEALAGLIKMRDQIIGTSEDAEVARARLTEIIKVLIALGREPTIVELQVLFEDGKIKTGLDSLKRTIKNTTFDLKLELGSAVAESVKTEAGILGLDAATLFTIRFREGMDPKVFAQILKDVFNVATPDILPHGIVPPGAGDSLTGKEVLGRIAGFDAEKVRAELSGSTEALVAVLRSEQAFLKQQLTRDLVKKQPGLKRSIESALLGVENDLESIAGDKRQAAEDAAKKIEDDNKAAATALIGAFSGQEQKLLNAETIAAETEGLKDDLRTDKAILRLYQKQKAAGLKKIKDAEALAEFLKAVNQKIFSIQIEIKNDKKALAAQIRQGARENREKIAEGLELDIEFAEITGNKGREIALRKKLIKALEDQIAHEKGNTLKIKQLRNEIARQKQAINEATAAEKDRGNAVKGLMFEFLTTQQGFAANLLGNLIPLPGLAGTVGGTTVSGNGGVGGGGGAGNPFGPRLGTGTGPDGRPRGPGAGIGTADALAGSKDLGPTRGGQSRELFLLERIASLLQKIHGGSGFPGTKTEKARTGGSRDTVM